MTPEEIKDTFERSDLTVADAVKAANALQALMEEDAPQATRLIRSFSGQAAYRMGTTMKLFDGAKPWEK